MNKAMRLAGAMAAFLALLAGCGGDDGDDGPDQIDLFTDLVLTLLPAKRQNLLFSATLNQRVLELAYEHMNEPKAVRIEPDKMTVDKVTQSVYFPGNNEKAPLLISLLREMDAAGVADDADAILTLPLTKGSVASYLGTVHETLSRTFARLIREGVIEVDGPQITIRDKKKLKRLV